MKDLPRFEPLEDRIVLDGEAQVTVTGPAQVELGAQDVEFTLTFDNVNTTDTGYLPFCRYAVTRETFPLTSQTWEEGDVHEQGSTRDST